MYVTSKQKNYVISASITAGIISLMFYSLQDQQVQTSSLFDKSLSEQVQSIDLTMHSASLMQTFAAQLTNQILQTAINDESVPADIPALLANFLQNSEQMQEMYSTTNMLMSEFGDVRSETFFQSYLASAISESKEKNKDFIGDVEILYANSTSVEGLEPIAALIGYNADQKRLQSLSATATNPAMPELERIKSMLALKYTSRLDQHATEKLLSSIDSNSSASLVSASIDAMQFFSIDNNTRAYAIEKLSGFSSHPDPDVRSKTAIALVQVGQNTSTDYEAIISLASHDIDEKVRSSALKALASSAATSENVKNLLIDTVLNNSMSKADMQAAFSGLSRFVLSDYEINILAQKIHTAGLEF